MKKLKKAFSLIFAFAIAFTCFGVFAACDNRNDRKIIVCETARSLFYAPLYVAAAGGYFTDEGLDVTITTVAGSDLVMTTVISGDAQIGLMGPETTVYCRVNGQKNYPVIFAQLTKRDGSFLVAKEKDEHFTWDKLRGKHVLAGRAGGVPAMTMQYVVNKAGLKTDEMNFDTDVSFGMMASVFESDSDVDYTTMFEPTASEYVSLGKGHIVAAVGEASGEVPYTAFSASKNYIDKNPDKIKSFVKAVIRGYDFAVNNDAETVAKIVQPYFAGIELKLIEAAIESYRTIDAWAESPVMKESAFENLLTIMKNAGYLSTEVAFSDIVDNSFAQSVLN